MSLWGNLDAANNAPKIEQTYIQKISKGNPKIEKQLSVACDKINKDNLKQFFKL